MQKAAAKWLMVAGVTGMTLSCWAEEVDAGKAEYLSNCAPCHGIDGKGKGPLSSKLKAKPADLTTFAKKNNGVFPLSAVYEAIDGRNATGSHDNREMPIWGCRRVSSPVSPVPIWVASAHARARSKNYAYQNWKAHLSGALRPDCGLARAKSDARRFHHVTLIGPKIGSRPRTRVRVARTMPTRTGKTTR